MVTAGKVGGDVESHFPPTERAAVGGSNRGGGGGGVGDRDQAPLPPQNTVSGGGGHCGGANGRRGRGTQAPPPKDVLLVSAVMAVSVSGEALEMELGPSGGRKLWKMLPRRQQNG